MSDSNEIRKNTVPTPSSAGSEAKEEQIRGPREIREVGLPGHSPPNGSGTPEPKRVTPLTAESPISPPSSAPTRPPSFVPPPRPSALPAASAKPSLAPAPPPMPPRPSSAFPASAGAATPATADGVGAKAQVPAMPPRPSVLPPPPRVAPAASTPGALAAAPANYPGSSTQAGSKEETGRISILPQTASPQAPTAKTTGTQPSAMASPVKIPTAPVTVAAPASRTAVSGFDAIPLPICWTIFGISAVTLFIQIWNYLSS